MARPPLLLSRSLRIPLISGTCPAGRSLKVKSSHTSYTEGKHARGRHRLRYPARLSVAPGPVTVRSLSNPKPGWSLADAVDLVRQGYAVAHAERVTGWAASVIAAQLKSDKHVL